MATSFTTMTPFLRARRRDAETGAIGRTAVA
jgi:hypothetical protein